MITGDRRYSKATLQPEEALSVLIDESERFVDNVPVISVFSEYVAKCGVLKYSYSIASVWFKLTVMVTEMTINWNESNSLTVTVTVTEIFILTVTITVTEKSVT